MVVISNRHRDELLLFLDALQGLPATDKRTYNLKRRALIVWKKLSEKSPVKLKFLPSRAYNASTANTILSK